MLGKVLIYIALALLTACIASPTWFAYVYFVFRPLLQPFALEGMQVLGIPLTGFIALQLAGFTAIWTALRSDFSFAPPNSLPLYVLAFLSLLSMINSIDLYASAAGLAKMVTAVMSYVLAYNIVKDETDAKRLLMVLLVATIVPMLVGYYQFFTDTGGRAFGAMNRVRGTLGLANAYGIYLAFSLFAAIILLLHPRWKVSKFFVMAVMASILVSTVIALNRGTWIALAFSIVCSSLLYIRRIKVRYLIVAAVLIAGVFSNLIVNRFAELEERSDYQPLNTFERRLEFWGATLEKVPEHLLIGWGIGTTRHVMQKGTQEAYVTHNDYLRLLLEVGVLGLAAYLWFLAAIAFQTLRRWRRRQLWQVNYPLMIAIGYFLIISLPQNIYDHMVNLPLFLTLVAVSYRLLELDRVPRASQPLEDGRAARQPWKVIVAQSRSAGSAVTDVRRS